MASIADIDFTPPAGVRAEAAKGLAWRREHGRGGTEIGIARGRDLSNGVRISPETARRMKAFFDRHQGDRQGEGWSPGEPGFPSNGRIAHALWGGDAGYAWARKLVRQMDAVDTADQRGEGLPSDVERRFLAIEDAAELSLPVSSDRVVRVERRAAPPGAPGRGTKQDWIVGYAAVFNVLSREITDESGFKFVEKIDPGAFAIVQERRGRRKPLETRALFDHKTWLPLAKYPKSLGMSVDEVGLKYEFPVPRTTYGRDVAINVEDGIVTGSSFTFKVPPGGDRWTQENGVRVRTILVVENVFDVGPVTFEAYPQAWAGVAKRSWDYHERSRAPAAKPALPRCSEALREYLRAHGRAGG